MPIAYLVNNDWVGAFSQFIRFNNAWRNHLRTTVSTETLNTLRRLKSW